MDIKSNGPELPKPVNHNDPQKTYEVTNNVSPEISLETKSTAPEIEPIQNQVNTALSNSSTPTLTANDVSIVAANNSTSKQTNSDEDVIKKDMVDKAKKIIKETSGDPRSRSSKLAVFKADYVESRFNKVIKVAKEES